MLDQGGPTRAPGPVPAGSIVYVAETRQSGWRLHVGATSVPPQPAFGWGMSFAVPGRVRRRRRRRWQLPPSLGAAGGSDGRDPALGWSAIAAGRSRSPSPAGGASAHGDRAARWFAPTSLGRRPGPDGGAADLQGALGAEDLEGEELWIDV